MNDATPFDQRRLLQRGAYTSGPGLKSLLFASAATVLLLAAVFAVSLLFGVIATSSARTLTSNEAAAIVTALGDRTPVPLVELAEADGASAQVSNAGVIPLLVHETYVGPNWLIWLARTFPTLLISENSIPILAAFAVLFLLGHHFCELAARGSAEAVARHSANRIRGAIHRQALRLNLGDLDGSGRKQARSLFTGQTDTISAGVSNFVFHVVRDPARVALCVIILLMIDWRLGLLTALPLAAAAWFVYAEKTRGVAIQKLGESRALRALRLLSEGLAKSRLIRGYGMETHEHGRFDDQLQRYSQELAAGADSWRHRQRLSWAAGLIVVGLVLYLVGMKVAFDPRMTIAEGVLFLLAMIVLVATLLRCEGVLAMYRKATTVNQQVNRYLDRIPEVSQAVGAKFLNPVETGIAYEGVTVSRNGLPLFENLELKLPAGSRTAFVSLDPKEARAAAFLLPRFIEPDTGRILFDGEDIAWGTLESLRAECCYVGGREPFFTGTVLENIAAGDQLSENDIIDAAKRCHAHKIISQLAEGYETTIGEHGVSLPPGHAFLLGLTRAIVRDPAVIIIEEPDATLDEDMKALVEDAYQRTLAGRTVVFLPHRLSTIRRADNVVVFSSGRVAAIGPQNELVQKNELYRHWEYVTFSPFGKRFATSAQIEEAVTEFGAGQADG